MESGVDTATKATAHTATKTLHSQKIIVMREKEKGKKKKKEGGRKKRRREREERKNPEKKDKYTCKDNDGNIS